MNKQSKKLNKKSVVKKDGPVIFVNFKKREDISSSIEDPIDIDSLQRDIENMELMGESKDKE